MMPRYIFFEGPDGCGKTNISKALANHYGLPYFKVSTERNNWLKNSFCGSIPFDILLPEFVSQTGVNFVSDRCYVSEIVYADVYNRETDEDSLWRIDSDWADRGAIIVMLMRRDYSAVVDELVIQSRMRELHDRYNLFCTQTKCDVIKIYVDDYDNDIGRQLPVLITCVDRIFGDPAIRAK